MTVEEIEKEIDAIISEMKSCIAEEEKNRIKTANYEMYKIRLAEAEEVKAEFTERKEKIDDFFFADFKIELEELKQPIY